jgi:hypothetical protein
MEKDRLSILSDKLMDKSLGSMIQKPKPSLSLEKSDYKDSAEHEVGKKYKVKMTLKKVGHHEDMFGGKERNVHSNYEVHNIESDEDDDHEEKENKGHEGESDKE